MALQIWPLPTPWIPPMNIVLLNWSTHFQLSRVLTLFIGSRYTSHYQYRVFRKVVDTVVYALVSNVHYN